jgi:cytochrome d ubiquinol oxidase subunit I
MMTAEILSRIQFAFTVSFHILFPAFTIGLSGFLVFFEIMWLKTKNDTYLSLYQFWSKIFALGFGMGVVTGIVLAFEIGTNFNGFTKATGNVLGPLLAYEVLTAFFLEAGFLGIMLFGMNKVGKGLHLTATTLVAIGTSVSAFWIIAVNSWMQFPTGYFAKDGIFFTERWMDVIFSPTFGYRLTHVILASYLTAAFIIIGISAYYLLRKRFVDFSKTGLRYALIFAAFLAPAQLVIGDLHGLVAFDKQPMKVAAMEGRWDTMKGAPLILFGIPDQKAEKNHFEISIPKGASYLLTHDPEGTVPGLKSVPAEDRPNMPLVFYSFRIMVGAGLVMILLSLYGALLLIRRKDLSQHRIFLRLSQYAIPAGFLATLSGWYVAEIGRQPWLVTGLLRIKDSVSPLPHQAVMISLILFVTVYSILLLCFLIYTSKLVRKGPGTALSPDMPVSKPMSARTPQGV